MLHDWLVRFQGLSPGKVDKTQLSPGFAINQEMPLVTENLSSPGGCPSPNGEGARGAQQARGAIPAPLFPESFFLYRTTGDRTRLRGCHTRSPLLCLLLYYFKTELRNYPGRNSVFRFPDTDLDIVNRIPTRNPPQGQVLNPWQQLRKISSRDSNDTDRSANGKILIPLSRISFEGDVQDVAIREEMNRSLRVGHLQKRLLLFFAAGAAHGKSLTRSQPIANFSTAAVPGPAVPSA